METEPQRQLHVVIVGPCASGKSTLVDGLHARGFDRARVVAQEHSGVRDLWKRRGQPDRLIFLDARAATMNARQHRADWTDELVATQHDRLRTARAECNLYLSTDEMSINEVLERGIRLLIEE